MGDKSKKSKSKDQKKNKSEKSAGKEKEKQKQKSPSKKSSKSKRQSKSKPLDNQSDVSSILPLAPTADCVHHKNAFIYFCETCQELVCNQCTVYGPHNNHLHRILKITDAYRSRVFYLSQAIRVNLIDKRDKIIAQLHRLEYRGQQIRFVKNIIERDIRSEYSGILQRLRNYEGTKLAILSHEVSLIQRQIDNINDIGNNFFHLTNMETDQHEQQQRLCKYLNQSKEMYESIEYIIAKPERIIPDVGISEIPCEVEHSRQQVHKALASKQINNFKNQAIWNLLNLMKQEEISTLQEVQTKAEGMIAALSQSVELMNKKLSSYKMICYFCDTTLSRQNINEQCSNNHPGSSYERPQNHHQLKKTPKEDSKGNMRHYFSSQIE